MRCRVFLNCGTGGWVEEEELAGAGGGRGGGKPVRRCGVGFSRMLG